MVAQKNASRRSKQRDLILKILKNTTSHPDADWIYQEVKKEMPNISLGTVYRNLSKMVDENEIIKIETGSDSLHYDARIENHCHIVCGVRERIDDIFLSSDFQIEKIAASSYGGKITRHSLLFFGYCPECAKKQMKNY